MDIKKLTRHIRSFFYFKTQYLHTVYPDEERQELSLIIKGEILIGFAFIFNHYLF